MLRISWVLLVVASCTAGGGRLDSGDGGPPPVNADGGSEADGGSLPADGGAGDGGVTAPNDPAACGIPLTAAGSLDLDVPTVRLTGTITLNGGPLPAAAQSPQILLRRPDAEEGGLVIDLGRAQANGGRYDVRVLPGSYELRYHYGACSATAYPCQQEVSLRGLSIASDGALDIDLDPIRLTGRVTLDGSPLPSASYTRGTARLRGSDGSEGVLAELDQATSGYEARVFRGTYDLRYDNGDAYLACTGDPFPCQQDAPWRSSLMLSASGALDLDLPTIRLSGRLTLDSAAPPSGGDGVFVAVRGEGASLGVLARFANGTSYVGRVLPGTYDLLYDNTFAATDCTGNPYPCQSLALVRAGVSLHASGALDLDVRTLRITGRVTLNGQALPSSAYGRGQLLLRGADDSTGQLVDLDVATGGAYDVHLLAGSYDILYDQPATWTSCTGSPYPCQLRTRLRSAVSLSASGALDIDLRTVRTTGTVTLAGASLPDAAYARGELVVKIPGDAESVGVLADLDRGGTYDARILVGTYDLLYENGEAFGRCTGNPYPCQRWVKLRSSVPFGTDAALDVDLPVVRLLGRITLDGAALPAASYGRGEIRMVGADASLGRFVSIDTAQSGYDVRIFPQKYDLTYRDDDARCTGTPFPCHARVLRGCDAAMK
jgi:hypothetical protein